MMGNNNKILTVSYGTFSCTLEGFEDSFDTMKAIAEYFRDLAADDRYFGAVPPTPDAAVMAAIAERETARQVAAHSQDGQIVLKAQEAPAVQAAPLGQVAPAVAGVAAAAALSASTAPAAEPATPVAPPAAPAPTSSIAERLQRIRAVVNGAGEAAERSEDLSEDEALTSEHSEPVAPDTFDDTAAEVPIEEVYEEEIVAEPAQAEIVADAPAEEVFEEEFEAEFEADAETAFEDTLPEPPADAEEASEAAVGAEDAPAAVTDAEETLEAAADVEETPEAAADVAEAMPVAEDVAEVEDDYEEEVSEDAEPVNLDAFSAGSDTEESPTAEFEPAEEPVAEEAEAVSEEVEEFASDFAEAESVDTEADEAEAIDAADAGEAEEEALAPEVAAALAELDAMADMPDGPVEEANTEAPAEAEESIAAMMANFDFDEGEDTVDTIKFADKTETVDPQPVDAAEAEASADEAETAAEADADGDTGEEQVERLPFSLRNPLRRRTRVIKVKRSDLEQAVADGKLEEEPEAPAAETPSSLSAQDEAELMADLARVEAEEADAAEAVEDAAPAMDTLVLGANDAVVPETEEAEEAEAEVRASDADAEENANADAQEPAFETDVNRLMDETEQQMEEPENAKRRSAFQALKAAVAARKGDRGMEEEEKRRNSSYVYRSDLAEVVQPRRPETPETTDERPKTRPAPLRLVAEQRVDTETAEPEEPVRPRRVAADAETAAAEGGDDFASYAKEKGVTDLSGMLEAAASYLVFVEGKEQFSRPQLMTKVRQVQDGDFSREDGLRSFGQLLRAGKIEKVAGGRFAVTSEIGYRPDQREAG